MGEWTCHAVIREFAFVHAFANVQRVLVCLYLVSCLIALVCMQLPLQGDGGERFAAQKCEPNCCGDTVTEGGAGGRRGQRLGRRRGGTHRTRQVEGRPAICFM